MKKKRSFFRECCSPSFWGFCAVLFTSGGWSVEGVDFVSKTASSQSGPIPKREGECIADLPSARRCLEQGCSSLEWGGGFSGALLLWQPRQDALEFAVHQGSGQRVGIDFEWSPGARFDFNVQFPNRSWDLAGRWTIFYNRSFEKKTGEFIPLWVLPQLYPSVSSTIFYRTANAVWKAHFNTIDLELGYDPLLTKHLSMRLLCGVKALSLFQHLTIDYIQGVLDGTASLEDSRCGLRTESLAIGPRIGFDSSWGLGEGWSLIGNFAGSLMLDYFVTKRKDIDRGSVFIDGVFRENFYAFHPALEAALGVGWSGCFGMHRGISFSVQFAYEVQAFWEQNMVSQIVAREVSFQEFNVRGDFAVQGITTTLSVGF